MRKPVWILALILFLSLLARLGGIYFDWHYRPDENQMVEAIASLNDGLNAKPFNYPPLYKYMNIALYLISLLPTMLFGAINSIHDIIQTVAHDQEHFYFLSRTLTAVIGTASVYSIFQMARARFDVKTALLSSAFLGFCYLHVRHSHFATTDVPMTFFIILCEIQIAKLASRNDLNNYAWAGALVGIATAVKYPAILMSIPLLVQHLLLKRSVWDKKFILASLMIPVSYLICAPYTLLDAQTFWNDFSRTYLTHLSGNGSAQVGVGWSYYFRLSLPGGLGLPLLITALIGLLLLAKQNLRKFALLMAFPIPYYVVMGQGACVFTRYAVPFTPYLCIGAAIATVAAVDFFKRKFPQVKIVGAEAVVAFIILLPSLQSIINFDQFMSEDDTRTLAREWAANHIPPASQIYVTGSSFKVEFHGFQMVGDREFSDAPALLPSYIVIQRSLLHFEEYPRRNQVEPALSAHYQKVAEFISSVPDVPRDPFDDQDAFFVPYTGFHSMTRPGPDLLIYKKI